MQINKRKAVTEISSVWEASRESGVWWKPFMRKIRENHSVAAPPKAYAKGSCKNMSRSIKSC
ncbi:hypothetical protein D5282_02430 [bacterium 1xD8-48]|jgi:hypothetical protein|nr:hypothetical protein [bacterium 1xD8-48]